ncbi:GlxA family transcriptional regulator [Chryseolinea lacunae]|uniref:Helix-turn-helix domain-containing protein n=1 Tax=Chryseolinea lacunae TaxID=2801331 RepID=A0ABS1KSK3_9BACT|nr:helix-turn-helix domain-containing protein [Chryseolinea lacunae]MBL0742406.1 helix-turn-helix domain-containing protein [Chryseolinea lacunae]
MEKFKFPHAQTVTAVFVIPPRVHLLDMSGPAHIFYEAMDYGAPLTLAFTSVYAQRGEETSSSGLAFAQLQNFEMLALREGDLVFVPGLESHHLTDEDFYASIQPFLHWLSAQHTRGVKICSVCTGAFIVAEAGLFNGRQTTTHWKFQHVLKQRYPKANVLTNRLFVFQDNLYSSAGVASGIDMGLFLLEELYGTRFAAAVAREVVIYLRRGQDDPQLSIFLQYRNHIDDRVHSVQEWLSHNLDKKHTADQLAERIHTSGRNLTRLFKDTTGITIGQYVEKLRVEHALQLLRGNQKVETVAHACGLQSTNQLRTLLKKHSGALPSDLMS